eukprot:TRINITY_DN25724_c0_g2_i1.p1 TRINITY_DN25724_c0_g2~~TRINITY_DN25724_c0_g2_i1.p1  ORF type:complete len:163 (-),score=22.11 TRINITY_DN25724_c0_g2_i1:11-499(-)
MYTGSYNWRAADVGKICAVQLSGDNSLYWQWYYPLDTFSRMRTRPNDKKHQRRQAQQASIQDCLVKGKFCSVSKHSRLGCAVVTFESEIFQAAVMCARRLAQRTILRKSCGVAPLAALCVGGCLLTWTEPALQGAVAAIALCCTCSELHLKSSASLSFLLFD